MNNIECTFKLAYTCNVITKVIDVNISPYDLKNIIRPVVNDQMELTEFKIIIAGTDLGEDNIDIDCNLSDVNISSLVGTIYNNHISFYIKPIYINEINSDNNSNYIISNYINNNYIINTINDIVNSNSDGIDSDGSNSHVDPDDQDCPICYTTFASLQTVRFGCDHTFCRNCTANWFRTGSVSCPLCRS